MIEENVFRFVAPFLPVGKDKAMKDTDFAKKVFYYTPLRVTYGVDNLGTVKGLESWLRRARELGLPVIHHNGLVWFLDGIAEFWELEEELEETQNALKELKRIEESWLYGDVSEDSKGEGSNG